MNLLVVLPLVLNVLSDRFLISMSSDGVHVKPTGPKATSPEHFFDLWMEAEHLFGGNGFCRFDDLGGRHHGHGLDEEVDVVLIRSDFHVLQFVALLNFVADVLECCLVLFCKDFPAIFGRTNQVVEEKSDVMALVDVLAAHGESLPCFTRSIAL